MKLRSSFFFSVHSSFRHEKTRWHNQWIAFKKQFHFRLFRQMNHFEWETFVKIGGEGKRNRNDIELLLG